MSLLRSRLQSPLSLAVFSVGVVLLVCGAVGALADTHPAFGVPGLGLYADKNLEVIGALTGGVAVLGETVLAPTSRDTSRPPAALDTVYITEPLRETLTTYAADAEPESVSFGLAATPADDLADEVDLPAGTPVFTDLYLPEGPNSVSAVFGMDLETPPQRTQGRFVSHPRSALRVTKRDDLQEVVFVAVPPWDDDSFAAFDRAGRRRPLRVLDAAAVADEPVSI